ncbi:hypothetical protein ACRQ5Q_14610 [Bradyrhizobium sp. PMVTL-01]|uniref:hypothetical protein n=1 Tax=Bradyrhizobium sp. PMVTL-01 TaxID=3434999 RepID=UPI003F7269CA
MSVRVGNLTRRERHFLGLLMEDGATISKGTSLGASLYRRGLLRIAKFGRYGITAEGVAAYHTGATQAKRQEAKQALREAQLPLF